MNIKDSNRHFDKLTNFYKQISADGHINSIELDLLKSYTLNFYESLVIGSPASSNQPKTNTTLSTEQKVSDFKQTPEAQPVAEQAPTEAPPSPAPKSTKKENKDLDQLFSLETGNEISDKLSISPINDINKAMSINERIFTIKELFGGSQESFTKTMSKLNEFSTYDDAKNYLSENIVGDNNWLDPEKSKKVKNFLKLISRKYI